MKNKCKWCGNNSGLMDNRGMCISCGGSLSASPKDPIEMWKAGTWLDHSGSSYGYDLDVYTPSEIRQMVGLDG